MDGHRVRRSAAIDKGAAAAVVEQAFEADILVPLPLFRVPDTLEALNALARAIAQAVRAQASSP